MRIFLKIFSKKKKKSVLNYTENLSLRMVFWYRIRFLETVLYYFNFIGE